MDRSSNVTMHDGIEVGGLSTLLHPDSLSQELVLILGCNGNSFMATIRDAGDGWTLLIEDMDTGELRRVSVETQDTAIVSALLGAIDWTWRQASDVD